MTCRTNKAPNRWSPTSARRAVLGCIAASVLLSACSSTEPVSHTPTAPAPIARRDNPTAPPAATIRIGLALGGGAAKGFAHIGVIKMLEANGLAPTVVAGTSAGSVVGALYASGMSAFELQEKAVALDETRIRDLQLPASGLLVGQKLEDYVNEQVRRTPLEQLAKPFAAVATRLDDGERMVFARGNTGQAVRASSSIPGVFQPVVIGNARYVDGGVVSPVPVDAARELGADVVVAVDISSRARGPAPAGLLGTISQTLAIMGQKVGQAELARADVVVRPQVLDIGGTDFTQRANAILEGEKAALAAMPQIRERISQLQAARIEAARAAQLKAAEAQRQACLDQRSRLQKLTDRLGGESACSGP